MAPVWSSFIHVVEQLAHRSGPAVGLKALVQVELALDLRRLRVDSTQEVLEKRCKLVQIGKAANGAHLLIATTKAAGSGGLLGRGGLLGAVLAASHLASGGCTGGSGAERPVAVRHRSAVRSGQTLYD